MLQAFHGKVRDHWLNQDDSHKGLLWDAPASFPPVASATGRVYDYRFRPSAMERFSMNFFLADTRVTRTTATILPAGDQLRSPNLRLPVPPGANGEVLNLLFLAGTRVLVRRPPRRGSGTRLKTRM